MNPTPHSDIDNETTRYVRITRIIRWLGIIIPLLTFPPSHPQAGTVYILLVIASLFNATSYLPGMIKRWPWNSTLNQVFLDTLLISLLIYAVDGLYTPYTMFYALVIMGAVYRRALKASLVITGLFLFLLILLSTQNYDPLLLDPFRVLGISIGTLLIMGLLLDRLTLSERNEQDTLVKLEQQMKAEQERLLVLVNSLTEAILLIDEEGKIVSYNASALDLLNTHDDLHGQSLASLLPLTTEQGHTLSLLDIADDKIEVRRSDLSFQGGPEPVMLELRIAPVHIHSVHKHSNNFVVICRDITRAKSLDQEREEFIAVTSHELRTPIAIAEAALSAALLPQMKQPQVTNLMKQAHRNVVFLGELMRDLNTLAEAHNDTIPIKLELVDPKTLTGQLIVDYQADADQKGLKLSVELDQHVPPILTTEHYVHEILQNYLVNALKYTNEGEIVLRVEPADKEGVRFSVRDTGVGISVSDQKHLFTKFYRSEDYRTRETGGTGLGLYLCAELAKRLNARVWCVSTLNQGSTFYLEVPPFSQLKRDRGEVVEAQVANLVEGL